jgi:hypothetical protein
MKYTTTPSLPPSLLGYVRSLCEFSSQQRHLNIVIHLPRGRREEIRLMRQMEPYRKEKGSATIKRGTLLFIYAIAII